MRRQENSRTLLVFALMVERPGFRTILNVSDTEHLRCLRQEIQKTRERIAHTKETVKELLKRVPRQPEASKPVRKPRSEIVP
jgi:hypothetical protein